MSDTPPNQPGIGVPFTPEPWVDAAKVAEHLGVTRACVLRWAITHRIPATPLPPTNGAHAQRAHWRFRLSEVESWMEARAIRPRESDR